MRKKSFLMAMLLMVATSMTLTSCWSYKLWLMGSYGPSSKTITTDLSYDEVWTKVIDFFAEASIPIGVIDKSSGLITATSVMVEGREYVTVEWKNGTILPSEKEAWFVIPYDSEAVWGKATCNFNIRVKEVGDKTSVQVNISNIVGYAVYFKKSERTHEREQNPRACASTGQFEEALLKYLTE